MILRRTRGLSLIHCAWQIALAELLFYAWRALPFGLVSDSRIASLSNYAIYSTIVGLALAADWVRGTSKQLPLLHMTRLEAAGRTARQSATVLVCLLFYLVASKDVIFSRLFGATFIGALSALLFATNRFFPDLIARFIFTERHRRRTLVMGDDAKAQGLQAWIQSKRAFGIEAVDFRPLEDLDALGGHLERTQAQQVMLLGFPESKRDLDRHIRTCERHGARLIVVTDWLESLGRPMVVTEDAGMQFISFQQDVLECPINRVAKRAFDLAIAVPICLFILPLLCILVRLIHRAQSAGPLFFVQRRTGAHGRDFLMFKFRSMHAGEHKESCQATEEDPRIFKAGRWMRKLSLDEMPQILNVLRGDMSIVGPRPHLKEHDEAFAETAATYRMRQMIKPGITGLAQVRGWRGETRTELDVTRRVEADLHYLENWSLTMDWAIVLKTAWQLVQPPRSAY